LQFDFPLAYNQIIEVKFNIVSASDVRLASIATLPRNTKNKEKTMKVSIFLAIAIFAPIALRGADDAPKKDLVLEVKPDRPDKPVVPRIVPGEKYTMEMKKVPKAEQNKWICRVTKEGWIELPIGGSVKVGGMTLREAERAIEDNYIKREIYTHPRILIKPIKDRT